MANSELSVYHEVCKIDTSKTAYFVNEVQNIVIEEVIIATEYDKESGKPIKETKTKRTITQDSDKVVSKKENKGESATVNDSLNHIADVSNMFDSETVTKCNGFNWLRIVTVCVIALLGLYLLKILRMKMFG